MLGGTVMISHPQASAWNTFKSSRQLAHSSSILGLLAMVLRAFDMIRVGSTPLSAIRPANTDTMLGVFAESALLAESRARHPS